MIELVAGKQGQVAWGPPTRADPAAITGSSDELATAALRLVGMVSLRLAHSSGHQ